MGRLGRKHGLLYSGSAHTFHLSGLHVQPTSYVGRRSHLTSPKRRPKRPSSGLKRAKFLARGQCTARFLSSARESSRRVFLTLPFLKCPRLTEYGFVTLLASGGPGTNTTLDTQRTVLLGFGRAVVRRERAVRADDLDVGSRLYVVGVRCEVVV